MSKLKRRICRFFQHYVCGAVLMMNGRNGCMNGWRLPEIKAGGSAKGLSFKSYKARAGDRSHDTV